VQHDGTNHHSADHAPSVPLARGWWESRPFLVLLVLAAAIPLLYPDVPPLVDLFGHMGRYRVQLDLAQSPALAQFYDFHWAPIGNLGVDVLVQLLAPAMGLEPAVKAIVIAIPMMTVAGFLWVAYETHYRIPPTALFALPFVYGFPFLFGFVNFALSMALAFLALGLWIRLGRKHREGTRALLFVPISFIVYFTHTFGWGMLGLLCFSAEAVRQHDRGLDWWKAGLRAAAHAAVMAGPLLMMIAWRSDVGKARNIGWFDWDMKIAWIASALRDRWPLFDQGLLLLIGSVLVVALASRALTFSRNLVFSALVLTAAFVILPWTVFSSAFADMRLVPYAMAVAVLAIRFRAAVPPRRMANVLALAGIAIYGAKIAVTTASLALAADRQEAQLAALHHVPVGARMVSFVGQPCGSRWPLFRHSHLSSMAIVRRQAFANDQWAIEGMNLLSVTFRQAGRFRADPSQMVSANDCAVRKSPAIDAVLTLVPRATFDYVWLIDTPPHSASVLAGYRPIWSGESSILYAREARLPAGAP
jgi:hypothetical protein